MIKDVVDSSISSLSDTFKLDVIKSINGRSKPITTDFQLFESRPFNPITKIRYQLASFSKVELSIYSILGKKVATLVDKNQPAGRYEIPFDASGLAPKVYLFKFRAGEKIQIRKLAVMK